MGFAPEPDRPDVAILQIRDWMIKTVLPEDQESTE